MAISRKKFVDYLLGLGGLASLSAIIYPVLSFMDPPKIAEADVNSIKAGPPSGIENNSGKIIKFGRKPLLLVKTDEGDFKAFNATCTHLDCIVQYRDDTKQIWCACHNGIYDINGRNLSGPPPKPLEEFEVRVIDNEIIISQV